MRRDGCRCVLPHLCGVGAELLEAHEMTIVAHADAGERGHLRRREDQRPAQKGGKGVDTRELVSEPSNRSLTSAASCAGVLPATRLSASNRRANSRTDGDGSSIETTHPRETRVRLLVVVRGRFARLPRRRRGVWWAAVRPRYAIPTYSQGLYALGGRVASAAKKNAQSREGLGV